MNTINLYHIIAYYDMILYTIHIDIHECMYVSLSLYIYTYT